MKGLVGVLMVVAVGLAGWIVMAITAPGQSEVQRRVIRTAALQAEAEALRTRLNEFEQKTASVGLPPELLHVAETASEATLELQRMVVNLAGSNGLVPSSFGGAPPPKDIAAPAVSVVLEGRGELDDVARFLSDLSAATPRVGVHQLALRELPGSRERGALVPVSLRVVVWGLWSREDGR